MLKTRYIKLFRDIRREKGKFILMVTAISVSLIGVSAVLSAFTIMSREIGKNYELTLPASATLEMGSVDDGLAAEAKKRPGIAAAEARSTVAARVRSGDGVWQPLLLFVIGDFDNMTLARFDRETGDWPPRTGTMLLERMGLELYGVAPGATVTVRLPEGGEREIVVSGTVHDPSLAPAWQGGVGYGYITRETLAALGGKAMPDELKITVADAKMTLASVTETALALAAWLKEKGIAVSEIQVPPPLRHPHQAQLSALLALLFIFSLCALVLGSILTASVISALLTKETRNIGVMKAIGGSNGQIASLYILLVLALSAIALVPGIAAGNFLGKGFASLAAKLLNITLYSTAVPWWAYAVQMAAGLAVPVLVSFVPIGSAMRKTVREDLQDNGVKGTSFAPKKPGALSVLIGRIDRSFILALRNIFRKRARLAMTLGLLAASGGMFMMTLNVKKSWDENLSESFKARRYDFELRMSRSVPIAETERLLRGIPGVTGAEGWGLVSASATREGGIPVSHEYPDAGHGSLSLVGVPDGSTLVDFPLVAGSWLQSGTLGGVVLNPQGLALLGIPKAKVGDEVSITAGGKATVWKIAGLVNEVGMAAAYVREQDFEQALASVGLVRSFRIVTGGATATGRATAIRNIEKALGEAGLGVSSVIADGEFRNEVADHIFLLILSLMAMAVLMAVVGLLALASSIGEGIIERKREFGVMRAIGAPPVTILRNVTGESVMIALLSFALALAASLPISLAVGKLLGKMAFGIPLSLRVSSGGMLISLSILVAGSIVSSAVPAWKAMGMTVRDSLSYE